MEFASAINFPEKTLPVLVSIPPTTMNFPSKESNLPLELVSIFINSSLLRIILARPLESVKKSRLISEIPSLFESKITKAFSRYPSTAVISTA